LESQADKSSFRSYLFFFAGQQASLLGSSISQFVIVWWITLTTGSPIYLSLAMIAGFAPMIVLTPFAGVVADRVNRKRLIGLADSLQAISTVVLIMLFWSGYASLWAILAVLVFKSVCQAFHMPAVTAIVPLMVPRDKLSRMNGLNYLLNGVMTLIGPIVAALLLTFMTIDQILWVDPATFFIAITPLLFIRIPNARTTQQQQATSFKTDFAEGIRFIKNTRGLVPLIFLATSLNFLFMPFATLLPYYIKFDHLGGAPELALVLATSQAGMLVGGIMMTVLKEFKRKMLMIFVSILISFIGYALIAFTPLSWFWFMAACAFTLDFGVAPANVTIRTIMQVIIPADMQGRVNSVLMSLATAASPLGMILAGALAAYTGTATLFLGCALAGVVTLLVSWTFTDVRHVEQVRKDESADSTTRTY
jgi:DHA3 family macrolide efflux protein-like MFS transporter